jgi:hypothetical protein
MDRRVWEADQVRELMKHPGMAILRAKIAEQRALLHLNWWKGASAEEAERFRQQARNIEAFFNVVKLVLMQGKVAAQGKEEDAHTALPNPPSAKAE